MTESIKGYGPYLTCTCSKANKDPSIAYSELDLSYRICGHIWEFMKHGQDVKMFGPLEGAVVVPMFVDLVQGMPLNVLVRVRSDKKEHGMSPVTLADRHVAYLDADEGRWSLRFSILEMLRGAYYRILPCQHGNHRYYPFSQTERDRLDLDSKSLPVLASVYSLLIDNRCWRCVLVNNGNEDLAPEL